MHSPSSVDSPLRREQLAEAFRSAERPRDKFLIGAETEKFGVHQHSFRPLDYGGDFSVCRIFDFLAETHGWEPIRETAEGPVLGLRRGGASITLEPAVQFELSGEAVPDLHAIRTELSEHFRQIAPICTDMELHWLASGFHPIARSEDLTWVPKQRYPIMRRYLPERGLGGLDMMQRTCTTQANFDWSSESDGMRKLIVGLRLAPLLHAWFANSPFKEGSASGSLSERGRVWQCMDPSRSGLLTQLWDVKQPTYEHYVEWALDAGMFLFRRDGRIVENTGQSFRDFLERGYEGHHAVWADWTAHLATLFPEVRMKNTLEVRSVDALPPALALSSIAVWTGILYDESSLTAAEELLSPLSPEIVTLARPELCDRGLATVLGGQSGFDWAARLLELAESGLARRARRDAHGRDESRYLDPARHILESRCLPAQDALARAEAMGSLVQATRIDPETEAESV